MSRSSSMHIEIGNGAALQVSQRRIGFVPIEPDMLSLALPKFYRDMMLEDMEDALDSVVHALRVFEDNGGTPIPHITAHGDKATKLVEMFKQARAKMNKSDETIQYCVGMSVIDHLVIIDRHCDMITPMMPHLSYAGVIEEQFGSLAELRNSDEIGFGLKLDAADWIWQQVEGMYCLTATVEIANQINEFNWAFDRLDELKTSGSNFSTDELIKIQKHKDNVLDDDVKRDLVECHAKLKERVAANLGQKINVPMELLHQICQLAGVNNFDTCNSLEIRLLVTKLLLNGSMSNNETKDQLALAECICFRIGTGEPFERYAPLIVLVALTSHGWRKEHIALIENLIKKQEEDGKTKKNVSLFLKLLKQLQLLKTRDEHYARESGWQKLSTELKLLDPEADMTNCGDTPWSSYGGYMPLSVRMLELANQTFLKTLWNSESEKGRNKLLAEQLKDLTKQNQAVRNHVPGANFQKFVLGNGIEVTEAGVMVSSCL